MSLLRLLQRLRNGQSEQRRGTPPAVEAALRAKRARAHLDRKRRRGRAPLARPATALLGDDGLDGTGALDGGDGRFAIDRSIPAGPLPSARPVPRSARTSRAAADATADLFAGSGGEGAGAGAIPSAGRAELPPILPDRPDRRTARPAGARRTTARAVAPPGRPLPRFVLPISAGIAFGLGLAAAGPLFEGVWLPRVTLERVAVVGTSVRTPDSIARALLASAGTPLDRIDAARVADRVTTDAWIESAESFRLPTGTLLVRVVERRAIARYQPDPEAEITLLDPEGRPFAGAVELGGPLPLIKGPIDGDEAVEILAELRRHPDLARDPMALTLHLPGSAAIAEGLDARSEAEVGDSLAGESGYVLEIGREGPRALLGQSYLKRRIARLAALLAQRDELVATARVIDLRFADRAVLRTEPTSG